jgi:D-alanyl-D-alanine carboxypeptidase
MRLIVSTGLWLTLLLGPSLPERVSSVVDARGPTESAPQFSGPPSAASDSLALQAVARALGEESGSPAVAVILVEGERILVGAWGERSAGEEDPVQAGDAWHLGSNTKAMTAVLAARLVEAGHLRWDTTVQEVLGEAVEVGAGFREVTLRELLSHRSGVEANLPPALSMGLAGVDSLRNLRADRVRYAATVLGMPPAVERGKFHYSNAGYVVAGAMMEAVTAESWETLLRREVWGPLGIEAGGFGPPAWIRGHRGIPDGSLVPVPPGPFADNIPAMGPGARAHLTADGYGRFLAAVLAGARGEGDPGFLAPESWNALHAPGGPAPPAYALGWGLLASTGDEGHGPSLQHAGSNTLWFTLARVDAGRNRAAAVLLNDGRLELVSPMATGVLERLLEHPPEG